MEYEKISISNRTVSIGTLRRRLKERTILAEVEIDSWDDDQQSQLIESLIAGIPIPLFYAIEDEDVIWKIIDGIQRIITIKRYIGGNLKLTGLDLIPELEGLIFTQLPKKFQARILDTEFQFIIINPSTPQIVQQNILKRLGKI